MYEYKAISIKILGDFSFLIEMDNYKIYVKMQRPKQTKYFWERKLLKDLYYLAWIVNTKFISGVNKDKWT